MQTGIKQIPSSKGQEMRAQNDELADTLQDYEVVELTAKEAAMLQLLRREEGRVVSRTRFLEDVWDGGETVGNRTVDTHMLNLRKKIESDPREPRHLLTVHGAGYRLILTPS